MTPIPSTTGDIRVSVDATFNATGDPVTFAFDAGSDLNRFLKISISWDGASAHTIGDTAVTFNGVALTALGATTAQNNARKRTFGLIAPATGSHTVSVDPSTGLGSEDAIIEVECFSGVHQTTAYDGYTVANATDTSNPYESALTVPGATGDLVTVSHMVRAASVTGGTATGFTERLDNVASNIGAVSGDQASAASVVTSVAWAGVFSIDYIAHGINLKAAAVGPPTGFVLDPESGTTNGSAVLVTTATSDDALTANGAVRLVTAIAGATVVGRLTHRPS